MTIPTNGVFPSIRRRSPTGSPDERFVLTLWTADVGLARRADAVGVDRIGVDLERLGKADRQKGLGTWISPHTEADLSALRPAVRRARLFARVNPIHAGTPREVDRVLALGAEVLMLPMAAEPVEAERFVDLVSGRATVVFLLECREALQRLQEFVQIRGLDEVHIGLNDLALSLGLPNRWLALVDTVVGEAARSIREAGLRLGLGGIGRVDDPSLPLPADLVYAECARTGATAALLSRSFVRPGREHELAEDVTRARARLAAWFGADGATLDEAHAELGRRARSLPGW